LSEDLTFFISALAIQAQEADRPDAAKITDVLKWQDEAGYPSPYLCTAKREQVTGSDSDEYQEEADFVERPVLGAKSSGARSVPHSCRATVIPKDSRVTDV